MQIKFSIRPAPLAIGPYIEAWIQSHGRKLVPCPHLQNMSTLTVFSNFNFLFQNLHQCFTKKKNSDRTDSELNLSTHLTCIQGREPPAHAGERYTSEGLKPWADGSWVTARCLPLGLPYILYFLIFFFLLYEFAKIKHELK